MYDRLYKCDFLFDEFMKSYLLIYGDHKFFYLPRKDDVLSLHVRDYV